MIRSADLQGKPVVTEDGRRLGHVDEVHTKDGRVTLLVCGGRGLFQRFRAARAGAEVRWEDVKRLTEREIVVANRGR
jgi:sporulation protein YlmC with PRC-barrel domain